MNKETSELYVVYGIWHGGTVRLAKETVFHVIDDARKMQDELMDDVHNNTTIPSEHLPRYFVATLEDYIDVHGSARYEEGYYNGHEACQYSHQCSNE
jgi:hypothetical protein